MPRKRKAKAHPPVQPVEEEIVCEQNESNTVELDYKLYLYEEIVNLLRELRLAHEEYHKTSRRR